MIRLYLARNRNRTWADMPALEFCAAELKRLDDQIRLPSTVGRWYLAPLLGGAALFVAGAGGPATSRVIVRSCCWRRESSFTGSISRREKSPPTHAGRARRHASSAN
jgi:hypothetical protein